MFLTMSSFVIAILFFSNSCLAAGPARVPLGAAINCTIIAESGFTCVPTCHITGNVCVSPAAATFITGCSLTLSADGTYATSPQITGRVYAASYVAPTPAELSAEVSAMHAAYNDAAGRPSPGHLNLASGAIGGLTLAPGLYKWTSGVSIGSSVTISGAATDTWIFQITGGLTIAHASVILTGGASPANIVWVVAGTVTLGTSSVFEGIVLGATSITLQTASSGYRHPALIGYFKFGGLVKLDGSRPSAIGGLTLAPGLYKWTSGVSIGSSVTISGAATDTWIFQVAGTLTIASGKSVILSGGASPANIVWVVSGAVTLGTSSVFEGIVLGATGITLQTASSITGRLFAQTAVALQAATVTSP
ncbi:hypothetical protein FIBSPDRAFT_999836 [Athelia psychrophila]|uniref:Antifreeze protein n=1 Tax=Athelia psychrophila TaxID=1759441 RepID=A0A167X3M3_9AGAM|nr:hypothetical protein FIBSPDRAFT_999836 [Fibularhizoctonia sp. CBS 109695]